MNPQNEKKPEFGKEWVSGMSIYGNKGRLLK